MTSLGRSGLNAGTSMFTFLLWACGPAAGTQAHDMSAAEHRAASEQSEAQGGEHADAYDPNARAAKTRCAAALATNKSGVCWSDVTNPTLEHSAMANKQRELAVQHRAASESLLAAEKQSCAGISDEDRDITPFAHKGDIGSVSLLKAQRETSYGGTTELGTPAGATLVFRAVPGLTEQWLQRIVECHLGRNAAIGHEAASKEMASCPLTLRGVQAKVRPLSDGFAVDVVAKDGDTATADEIWRRAQALGPVR